MARPPAPTHKQQPGLEERENVWPLLRSASGGSRAARARCALANGEMRESFAEIAKGGSAGCGPLLATFLMRMDTEESGRQRSARLIRHAGSSGEEHRVGADIWSERRRKSRQVARRERRDIPRILVQQSIADQRHARAVIGDAARAVDHLNVHALRLVLVRHAAAFRTRSAVVGFEVTVV